jgi:hypothetical protein
LGLAICNTGNNKHAFYEYYTNLSREDFEINDAVRVDIDIVYEYNKVRIQVHDTFKQICRNLRVIFDYAWAMYYYDD